MPDNPPNDHQSLKDAVLSSDHTISKDQLFFSLFIKVFHEIQGWSSTLPLHIVSLFSMSGMQSSLWQTHTQW